MPPERGQVNHSGQHHPLGAGNRKSGIWAVSLQDLLDRHVTAWTSLLANRGVTAPFLDSHWIETYRNICAPDTLRTAAAWEDDRLVGVAVLNEDRSRPFPYLVRSAQSPTFDCLSRYEFLVQSNQGEVLERLWRFWLTAGLFSQIQLELLAEDSDTFQAGLRVAEELGWTAIAEITCRSPWLRLPDCPEDWDKGLKSKFKANLRNRERRLSQLGEVCFEVVRESARLRDAMEVFYTLEASGWKHRANTSIAQQPRVRKFYDALVARVPQQIWVPILSLNGKPIAAQFIRTFGETVYLLKIGFDPQFSPYSPGQLITARTLAYASAEHMKAFDFLGEQMTWKMDWNPEVRSFCRLVLCSPTLAGRYAYWTRFGYREVLKRIPGLHSLVRRLRGSRELP